MCWFKCYTAKDPNPPKQGFSHFLLDIRLQRLEPPILLICRVIVECLRFIMISWCFDYPYSVFPAVTIWESSSVPPQNKGSCVESQEDNFKGSNGSRFAAGRRRFWLRNNSAKHKDQKTLVVPSVIFLPSLGRFKFKAFWILRTLSFGKTFQFD